MNDTFPSLPAGVRACLFDFDLTLADGSPWIVKCYQDVLRRHGFADVPDDTVRGTIGLTVEDSFGAMTGITDAARLRALRMEYKSVCRPRMAEHTRFFPDAAAFVRRLRRRGTACAIVSTKETAVLRRSLEACGMADCFALVVGLDEVSAPKPSPEGILFALRQLGVPPAEAVYFGDSAVDGEAARRAGVPFVGVAKGAHPAARLAEYPHLAVIDDYDRLGAPPSPAPGEDGGGPGRDGAPSREILRGT